MKIICLILSMLVYGLPVFSKTVTVHSIAALQEALGNAKAGEVIIVADGVYTTDADVIIKCIGTKGKPIIISAAHTGMTEITGKGGFNIAAPACYVIVKGFRFTHTASKARTQPGTSFCRFTENIFETPGNGENLTIAGNDHEIDHNDFQNKNAMGRFLAIRGAGSQIAERLWIHHNYFKSHKDQGGANGAEAFQFGLSGFSLSSSHSIVEYNLFEDCAGENELISVKASAVTLRYNTIRNCPAQFTLRHGNKCEVYGNYFFNTPGLRIFGDDHLVHSNYFENCSTAITIGNGDGEVADGAQLTAHDRPDRVFIGFNTLMNNKENIIQQGRKDGMGSTYITVAANIIQGGAKAAAISGPNLNGVWTDNLLWKTEAGDIPETGFIRGDPKLVRDKQGVFHLPTKSPAIDAAKGKYTMVKTDLDGQARTGRADIGADELSPGVYKNTPLQRLDAGTAAVKQ